MSALDAHPIVLSEEEPEPPRPARRPRRVKGSRPGWFVYGCLGVVLLASIFPFYWSLLIGSGTSYTIRDPNMSWLPGGNFFSNAAKVINDPAVNFWVALWNSIVSSGLIALSVVFFSTLAGWAFAKLRFKGSSVLLVFVIATMAVPMQLGVVPLYILFSEIGWTGNLGAIIIPALVSAFGVFWMTQYIRQAVPDELIEAARVDGATAFRTFLTVGVPAARPAAAMLGLFTFVSARLECINHNRHSRVISRVLACFLGIFSNTSHISHRFRRSGLGAAPAGSTGRYALRPACTASSLTPTRSIIVSVASIISSASLRLRHMMTSRAPSATIAIITDTVRRSSGASDTRRSTIT